MRGRIGVGTGSLARGNAGRAEDIDFWHASEDGEVRVIGEEVANTDYDPDPSVEAHIARRGYVTCRGPTIVGLACKRISRILCVKIGCQRLGLF